MAFAASSQNMLEVHMSTIYHKGGKSLPLPNPLYSVRNEMIMAPNKTMAPFKRSKTSCSPLLGPLAFLLAI